MCAPGVRLTHVVVLVTACGFGCGSTKRPERLAPGAPATAASTTAIPEPSPSTATPLVPGPRDESGLGDRCETDADCHFLDLDCAGTRCGSRPRHPDAATDCPEIASAGTCHCVNGRCALRPGQASHPDAPPPVPCARGNCGLDEGAGSCLVGEMLPANRVRTSGGPMCRCDESSGWCVFEWLEPIPCRTKRDCWFELEPRPHPVPRPRHLRRRTFRPCEEGETGPVCWNGVCDVVTYPC